MSDLNTSIKDTEAVIGEAETFAKKEIAAPWVTLVLGLILGFALGVMAGSCGAAHAKPLRNDTSQLTVERVVETQVQQDSIAASSDVMVPFRSELIKAGYRHQVPAALLAAFCQEESAFDPWAERSEPSYLKNKKIKHLSHQWSQEHGGLPTALTEQSDRSKSMGLMQPMGEVAREQGYDSTYLSSLFEPINSIDQGARLLRKLLDRYGRDTLAAISAYNQGSAHKSHGTFDNARYVYRVSVAWHHYSLAFKHGYTAKQKDSNDRILTPYGVAPGGFMVRAAIVRHDDRSSDTSLDPRDTLGKATDRHGDTARYGAITGAAGIGPVELAPSGDGNGGSDGRSSDGHTPLWQYFTCALIYVGVLGYFAYDIYRDNRLAGQLAHDHGHDLGVSRRGDGLLHG